MRGIESRVTANDTAVFVSIDQSVRTFYAPSYPYTSCNAFVPVPPLVPGTRHTRTSERINPAAGILPQAAPVILRHFYHWGLLLLSSSCYYLSVGLASEFGRVVVLPHPDGLDEIDSDRADIRGLTASGGGMLLHRGQQLSAHPLELLLPSCILQ